jgi:RNA polymerase sigma-70 factor (ECF subfamily)
MPNIAGGDEHAFRQLYDCTCEKTFRYLFRLTADRQAAEDLMIDTYTQVWKSAGQFGGRSRVQTWIIGIARNLAMSDFRKKRWKEVEIGEETPCMPSQFQDCASEERVGRLAEALNRVPLPHREVLDCVFLQDMRYEDISRLMGIPVNTVKTRVFYAKEKMREILRAMGYRKDDLL